MKIFFCGQKSFGYAVLKALHEDGHEIVGVCPPPQIKYYDKTKQYAIRHGLPVIGDCDKLVSQMIPDETDLIVAAHSHWYISSQARGRAKYGAIGFHPSLLPRHRGQDAVRWAVAMGDAITGATVYRLDDTVDGGDIIAQRHIFVDRSWDYHDLWKEIFPVGVEMMRKAASDVESGIATYTEQDDRFATWEPKIESNARLKRNELIQITAAK